MAKTFERHFADVPVAAQKLPRAPVGELSDTGQTFAAQALAQAGEALTDTASILFKWNGREGNSEYDTARGFGKSLIGEFERTGYADSTDFDAGVKKLEADLAKVPADNNLKNKSGARKYKEWLGLNKAGREKIAAEKRIRMIDQNNQAALFNNLTNVAKDYTDTAEAKARIKILIAGGLDDGTIRTASQAIAMEDKANANWLRADVWRRATSDVRPDGEVDWSQAAKWFDNPENIKGLPEEIVEDFAGTARSQAAVQKRRDDQAIENAQSEQRDNIYEMIEVSSADTIDTINRSNLTGKEKAELRKLARSPDVTFDFTEYNNVVAIIDGVARGTHTMKKANDAIAGGVGKHFDATIARSLRSKLSEKSKADSPLNTSSAQRAQASLGRLRQAEISLIGFKEGVIQEKLAVIKEIEERSLRKSNEYDAYLLSEEGRKATDKQREEKLRSLSKPAREAITLNWFEKLLEFFVVGTGGRGVGLGLNGRGSGITATNPETGNKVISFDGGKTWQPL